MSPFNIRVYGLLMNDQNQVLVSDERRNGVCFSKFPGGGVEFSEGLHDALQREFMEELKIEIQIGNLFYVNTHLQISAFNSNQQLLAFYFFVNTLNHSEITTSNNYKPLIEDGENQRWVQVNEELKNLVTFPLDKIVADKLVKFLLNE
jgi:8-oxo-dGTP pyrophosphatase MutT (NUDIX family)